MQHLQYRERVRSGRNRDVRWVLIVVVEETWERETGRGIECLRTSFSMRRGIRGRDRLLGRLFE
jgi:hypothetical protein